MKKVFLVCILFVLSLGFAAGCDRSTKVTGGTGLPDYWRASWVSTPDSLFYTWHVGDTVTFVLTVFDENGNEVPDYDKSSATWRIEQEGNIATLSDTTGPITYVTAQNVGTFTLYSDFQGTNAHQRMTVHPL